MKLPGIVGMIQWASGLVLAIPLAIIGVEFFGQGRPYVGVGFLLLALVLFVLPEYVTRKVGTPRTWIKRRLFGSSDRGER